MRRFGEIDADPVIAHRLGAGGRFLITCDHAGRAVPARLGDLGLPPEAFARHIAWDIGAGALSRRLGDRLDATVIAQAYSRLVIDCNRAPGRADSILEVSDGTPIPANLDLTQAEAAARLAQVHAPYHQAIADALDRRPAGAQPAILLFIHSFTPRLNGQDRPWTFGVLHAGDSPFSDAMLARLRQAPGAVVGDNQPYTMDETDYSAARHARARGLDYLELEVRQDLIADEEGVERVARLLAPMIESAAR